MKEILQQAVLQEPTERSTFLKKNNITLLDLLSVIGDPDPELRDQLAYRIFAEMLSYEHVESDILKALVLKLASEDYLFYQIGENETTSVYTRSFSALWLTLLLKADIEKRFLSIEESQQILEKAAYYLQREKDTRGFVEGQGWANSITHGIELYQTCVLHPTFPIRLVATMLQGIQKAIWSGHVFVNDEETAMAQLFINLAKIQFPEDVLVEWIEQLFDKLQFHLYEQGYTPHYFKARTNTIHAMQALYFKLKFSKTYPKLQGVASIFIAKWS